MFVFTAKVEKYHNKQMARGHTLIWPHLITISWGWAQWQQVEELHTTPWPPPTSATVCTLTVLGRTTKAHTHIIPTIHNPHQLHLHVITRNKYCNSLTGTHTWMIIWFQIHTHVLPYYVYYTHKQTEKFLEIVRCLPYSAVTLLVITTRTEAATQKLLLTMTWETYSRGWCTGYTRSSREILYP